MESTTRKPVAPFYAVAVLWLVGGLLLPFYAVPHYVLMAAVSAAVFYGVNALCKSGGSIGGTVQTPVQATAQTQAKPQETPQSTGNPELDKMLKDGRLAIQEMKRLDDNIEDAGISAHIVRLEQVSQKIFDEVRRAPEKLPQIRRFMDYYLPTTLKLLNSYDRMSGAGVSGENINTTLDKVEGILHTIVTAFEKQLDSLYGAEAMDISADISVLETMMAREGLSGSQMNTTTSGDSGITLEL